MKLQKLTRLMFEMRETQDENNIEEAQFLKTAFCFNSPQSVDIISLTGYNIELWGERDETTVIKLNQCSQHTPSETWTLTELS